MPAQPTAVDVLVKNCFFSCGRLLAASLDQKRARVARYATMRHGLMANRAVPEDESP